jgi:hypothetical protein
MRLFTLHGLAPLVGLKARIDDRLGPREFGLALNEKNITNERYFVAANGQVVSSERIERLPHRPLQTMNEAPEALRP